MKLSNLLAVLLFAFGMVGFGQAHEGEDEAHEHGDTSVVICTDEADEDCEKVDMEESAMEDTEAEESEEDSTEEE